MSDLTELSEVYRILSVHPGFRVSPVRMRGDDSTKLLWLGRLIKRTRLRTFGAEFDRKLAMLSFQLRPGGPRELSASFQWHAVEVQPDWCVFLHFIDERGEIRFQGDHPFEGEPDELGFLYYRKSIAIPTDAPSGSYRVRLGVWSPPARSHVPLSRYHGCVREAPGWCYNAVLLASVGVLAGGGVTIADI